MKNNSNLDLIRERLNILDVVSTYIKLDKAGSQYRAKCPFHNEKSPSFYVSPSRGSYHCFGCSEHGDIFGFVMKIEGINFKDALKLLADRAGVTLSNFKKEETSSTIDILESTTTFFEQNLNQNKFALEYIKSRGINSESINKFRIGYASNEWRELYTKLNKAGYSDEEIVTAGVCIKHEKGLYDRFRSRIIFPIMNASGKVVAFTGRIIGEDEGKDGVAKYVNSPETPMYHKSSILFGYDKAKSEIAKTKKIIVVEGQMDVVMAYQAGNTNTVAISGTAFTPEHISIIKRFADTVILALDTDKAGYTAMLKSAALALENDLEVEGIKLIDKDPADMIKHDINSWKSAVEHSKPILNLILEIIMEKEHIKPKQIQMLRKDLFPLLRVVKSPLLKASYIKEIAKSLEIEENIIKQETEDTKTEIIIPQKKELKRISNLDLGNILAETVAAISILENLPLKNFYDSKLKEILGLQTEFSLESIPEEILNREIIVLEKKAHDLSEFNIEKHTKEVLGIFIRKILEKIINNAKLEIGGGENLEQNLKLIQENTKKINQLSRYLTQ